MNVAIKESEGKNYPCLKETDNKLVVLFESEQCGIVLSPDKSHSFGEIRKDWISSRFSMTNKVIELSNG